MSSPSVIHLVSRGRCSHFGRCFPEPQVFKTIHEITVLKRQKFQESGRPQGEDSPNAQCPASVQRGDYSSSIFSKSLFVVGRLVSGPLQCILIRAHLLSYFGVALPPAGGSIHLFGRTYSRLPLLTALMPTILAIEHAFWVSCWARERMTPTLAVFGILADFIFETVTSIVFTGASTNLLSSERKFYIGNAIFFTGMAIELVAELHRASFRSKPENEGKLCTTGLWTVARHINYSGHVMFGFGVGLAVSRLKYSLATAGMYLANFTTNAMPSHGLCCKRKYGQQWTKYEKEVPRQLVPGIY